MAKNEFKTAAAKLLAQHTAKMQHPAPPPSPPKYDPPKPASLPAHTSTVTQRDVSTQRKIANVPSPGLSAKLFIKLLAALMGCAIMVFLVPETIFGITFNIVFGAAAGAILGHLIIKDM